MGLPWMCIFTTIVSYVIRGVPPFLLLVTTLLGFYAIVVLAIRFAGSKIY